MIIFWLSLLTALAISVPLGMFIMGYKTVDFVLANGQDNNESLATEHAINVVEAAKYEVAFYEHGNVERAFYEDDAFISLLQNKLQSNKQFKVHGFFDKKTPEKFSKLCDEFSKERVVLKMVPTAQAGYIHFKMADGGKRLSYLSKHITDDDRRFFEFKEWPFHWPLHRSNPQVQLYRKLNAAV